MSPPSGEALATVIGHRKLCRFSSLCHNLKGKINGKLADELYFRFRYEGYDNYVEIAQHTVGAHTILFALKYGNNLIEI